MRFGIAHSKQYFEPRPGGGTHTVVASDPTDRHHVELIRQRVLNQVEALSRGEFGGDDVSGHAMEELEILKERHDEIEFTFSIVPGGAKVQYRCKSEDLVETLRKWLDEQRDLEPEIHEA